jgi:hypothetical protein
MRTRLASWRGDASTLRAPARRVMVVRPRIVADVEVRELIEEECSSEEIEKKLLMRRCKKSLLTEWRAY